MTPQEAKKYLIEHPSIEKLIIGMRHEDGNLFFDCAACISDADYKKEVARFAFVRVFELKEIK
jgi:hypothetical protein